jgi:hypothetical protein
VIESKCAVLHYINAVGCTISPVAALEWSAHAKAALMVSDGAHVIQLHMRFDGYIEFHVMLWLVSGSSFALLGFSRRLIRLRTHSEEQRSMHCIQQHMIFHQCTGQHVHALYTRLLCTVVSVDINGYPSMNRTACTTHDIMASVDCTSIYEVADVLVCHQTNPSNLSKQTTVLLWQTAHTANQ